MEITNSIPSDILKIQKKLCQYNVGSRNYKKYEKILAKHIKNHSMRKRVNSNIKTIEIVEDISSSNN